MRYVNDDRVIGEPRREPSSGRGVRRRRRDWYLDYVEAILQRDIRDIARIEQLGMMPRLMRVLAEHSGQLANHSGFGAPLGMNHVTARKYVSILEKWSCPS